MRHPDPHFGYPTVSWRTNEQRSAPLAAPASRHRFLRQGTLVLDTHVDAIDLDSTAQRILTWGSRHQSRIVTLCRVDTLVQAARDPALHRAIAQADLALPGEAAVAWAMRREGQRRQLALTANDLMWRHLALAEQAGQAVHFHGGSQPSIDRLLTSVQAAFPGLPVTGTPGADRPLTPAEDLALAHRITSTGAQVVFVGLDDAEQAHWMNAHRHQVRAVMIGLGHGFGQPHAPTDRPSARHGLRRRLASRAVFFTRILQNFLLGAPPSRHDDPR